MSYYLPCLQDDIWQRVMSTELNNSQGEKRQNFLQKKRISASPMQRSLYCKSLIESPPTNSCRALAITGAPYEAASEPQPFEGRLYIPPERSCCRPDQWRRELTLRCTMQARRFWYIIKPTLTKYVFLCYRGGPRAPTTARILQLD